MTKLTVLCDEHNRLVCLPYSDDNLHEMSRLLGVHHMRYRTRGVPFKHYELHHRRADKFMLARPWIERVPSNKMAARIK